MRVVSQVLNRTVRFGGEEHSGWLPLGATVPQPVPIRESVVDLEIVEEAPGSVLLICKLRETKKETDDWFESVEGAKIAAQKWYGVDESEWE